MKWFGATWDAPINESCEQTDVPVGWSCLRCNAAIEWGDRGVTMPYVKLGENGEPVTTECAYHLHCHMYATLGEDGDLIDRLKSERPELFP